MEDKKTIENLKKICNFNYFMEDNYCVSISFHDEDYVFGGTIRKNDRKKEIIKTISKFEKLKILNLRKCKTDNLPEFTSRELEYVDLSCNNISDFPSWILKQPNINFLNLGANKLNKIPNLSNLPIETLKIHKNFITDIPETNNKIKTLNLYLNPINEVPTSILKLNLLEVFSFGVTNAKKIPSLLSLSKLKWLILTVNNFELLPEDICELKKLEGLVLAKNKIKKLPKKIGDMNIKYLTLYSNNLTKVPESFFNLKLNKLNLSKNPIFKKDKIIKTFENINFFRI